MTTFLATPETWFDLPRQAEAAADAGVRLTLSLTGPDGHAALADVRLDELLAVHRTYGSWWGVLGDGRSASLDPTEYSRFLVASRALLQHSASAAAANPDGAAVARTRLLALPPLNHALFAEPVGALGFLKTFFALEHAPSLMAWARANATSIEGAELCRGHAWLRLAMQKVASEDRLPEALACLRAAYGGSDEMRRELLADEAGLLERAGLQDLRGWARSLGVDRPARTEQALPDVALITRASRSVGSSDPTARAGLKTRPHVSDLETRPYVPPPHDVTVLVPSYQHESFVCAALESVLAQTYPAFRILVVDDGSTDRTVERARQLCDPRIEIHVNDRNLGLGDSLLRALDHVTTPYVALLNSDDLFHPDRLERCRAVLEQEPHIQVVATGLIPIDESGARLSIENSSRLFDGDAITDWVAWFARAAQVDAGADLFASLLERNFLITSSNLVCRTDFLRTCRDALSGLKYCFDWQVLLDAAADESLVFLRDELLGYRLHGTNTVWFDERRREEYVREVNRVLAAALNRWRVRAALRPGGVDVAKGLELLTSHAAKHPDARGLFMFVSALAGEGAPSQSSDYSQSTQGNEAVPLSGSAQSGSELQDGWTSDDVEKTALRALADVANEQAASVYGSPEWLLGEVLWNRLQLSRIGEPAALGLRWLLDRRNRWRLALRRTAGHLRLARPTAVVAASWRFPVHSHTFVYQEMQALEWMGLEPVVFCCATNDRSELHAAFDGLWRRRVVLRTEQQRNREDFEYFRRTRGERVDTLLSRLAAASGLTSEALLREPAVMMGFSFARHVEISGAVYLHTYFFYDQSLMALIAGVLLGIPRGVTAYADHMLHDYPLKCVALHLELADVVVATSRRIKHELSVVSAGRFDSKILVKPNGVDSARFTYVDAATRLKQCRPFELISVSRIEPKKGLVHLVEAVDILRTRGVVVRLNIVGGVDPAVPASARCARELRDAIEARRLSDLVVRHGTRTQSEIAPLLARSHVYVAPYVELASGDKDGIPTSLLEAMAAGLPVVTTDAGSIVEAVTDDVEGFCVPQRDAERLANAIQRLIENEALYTRMSTAARTRAVSEFDAHVTEARLHERVRALLAARR